MGSPGCAGWMQNCFARPQLPELLTDAQPPAQLGMLLGENQRKLRDLHTIVTPWWWSRAARSGVAMNSPWTIARQDQLASKCARLDLPAINHARQVSDRESKSSTKTLNEPLLGRHTGRIRMKESHHDPSVIAPWGLLHRTRRCELAESSIDRNTRQSELQNGNINAGGEERRAARRRNACGASGRERQVLQHAGPLRQMAIWRRPRFKSGRVRLKTHSTNIQNTPYLR